MKKIINDPKNYVDESLEGLVLAYPSEFECIGANKRVVVRPDSKASGKVGLATGGGFGHLPLFAGYVGEGLLDSCAVGDVFAGPSANDVTEAIEAADFGSGVLSIIGNYGGDRMVFNMVKDALESKGVRNQLVIVADDVASAPPLEHSKRRGVAGLTFAFKIAGAAAERGRTLDDVAAITERAMNNCRSIGVALSSCTIPQAGKPTFEIDDESIEMGMGIHGEQGVWRGGLKSADDLADEMLDRVLEDNPIASGERIALLCNSLGATPIDELFIFYRRLAQRLSSAGVDIALPMIGHYTTSMEMAGITVSVMTLDDELESLMREPAACPFWRNL